MVTKTKKATKQQHKTTSARSSEETHHTHHRGFPVSTNVKVGLQKPGNLVTGEVVFTDGGMEFRFHKSIEKP